jgi:ABC-type multidrug transport system fused ATPase/permease subunit
MSSLNAKIAEVIRCFALIKSLGTEESERKEFEEISRRYSKVGFIHRTVSLLPGLVIEISAYATLLAAVSYLYVRYISGGTLNPYIVISYLIFANKFVDSTTVIAGTISQLVHEAAGFESIQLGLAARPVQEISYGDREVEPSPQPIEVEDVFFAHSGQVVLDGCSFKVDAGELVAIVGHSGAGKSTLALILAGLYRPQRGLVRIGDVPLSQYRREALTRFIGYQPQEPRLVDGTIRENLIYGLTTVPSEAAIDAVLLQTHLNDLMDKKEEQMDANVGERGGGLSGGERQRLALARILLREPGILILDEITSALDLATERVVLDGLESLRGKKTVVFITHRLRSAAIADRILVLDQGHIVEEGAFDELLERGGQFSLLSRSQR